MSIEIPAPDQTIMQRRAEILAGLSEIVPDDCLITRKEECRAYEADALTAYRRIPMAVVLPTTTQQVSEIVKFCQAHHVKIVPRGAGTSLAGGALPVEDGIILGVSRMTQILDIDYANRTAKVQAGVTNINITNAVAPDGFFYAPDPSSQLACTIAGNIAMNSGGAHCLKYGVTTNNILGLTLVLMDGTIVTLGGDHLDSESYDLLGLIIGSEGQLGIVTEATVRILAQAEGARPMLMGFQSPKEAGACVAAIIGSGIIPVAIEYMDKPAIKVCEDFAHAGYPLDVEALLIIEVEGSDQEMQDLLERITQIAQDYHPSLCKISQSEAESSRIWLGRKSAFGAMGRISDYMCMDGTIPTGTLPHVLERIDQIVKSHGLGVANIFHAGDGNLHPLILYNINDPKECQSAEEAGAEILKLCVEVGGCLSGEHGVGIEKRDLMTEQFTQKDLDQQMTIKSALDPNWLLNPVKVFPLQGRPESQKALKPQKA
ncbi:MAG: FAD-binding protein [Cohaesibacter sp.]|nr:FAD-binding protein [Cohaesibacter sp.]